MGSRIRISYQWQLFIPLAATLWLTIIGMTIWQYKNERRYRIDMLTQQVELINSRVIAAYEQDVNPQAFVEFIVKYYRQNKLFDQLRLSIYNEGKLVKAWGEPIGLSDTERSQGAGFTQTPEVNRNPVDAKKTDRYFYYNRDDSADGKISVYTVVPYDTDILDAALPSNDLLWVMLAVAVVMTIISYISTRYFGKNIKNLRAIAERAATDPEFMPTLTYPHDELGDITRQIIHMYNERSQAMQRQRREHNVALHAIEEKARAKRQLTNNINHELRTPIGVVKGYLDTILQNPDMDAVSRTHFLTKAQEHINRLANLISDVSAITRLDEGGELISTEELDFHDVVYTIAGDLEESKTLGNMVFNYNVPLDCKVMGNYNLLSGMILNLCKNAAAYSKGTKCELILTHEDEKFYYFEFRDDGTGVGEEHLPHLFERFYRIDSGRSRKAGGTGLGLPIVQNTILALGGEISVCNGELGGLAFDFSLPKYTTSH